MANILRDAVYRASQACVWEGVVENGIFVARVVTIGLPATLRKNMTQQPFILQTVSDCVESMGLATCCLFA